MTEPTTADIRKRHDADDKNKWAHTVVGIPSTPHKHRGILLKRLEAAELLITTLYDSGCLDIEREELVRKHIYGASHE